MDKQLQELKRIEMEAMVDEIQKQLKNGGVKKSRVSSKEIQDLMGVNNAVRMNFIPMMFGFLIISQVNKMLDYAATNRISDLKAKSRVIRGLVAEYEKAVSYAYADKIGAFRQYVEQFMDESWTNAWKMALYADTLAKNRRPALKHPTISATALVVRILTKCCDRYDDKMEKELSEKLKATTNRRKDIYIQSINLICADILADEKYSLEPDNVMEQFAGALLNQAWRLVDAIIEKEDAEEAEQNANKS